MTSFFVYYIARLRNAAQTVFQKTMMNMLFVLSSILCLLAYSGAFVAKSHHERGPPSRKSKFLPTLRVRKKRSLSMSDFKMVQGNWKFSKEEIRKMFDEYYECIKKKREDEEKGRESIDAVLALEGQRVELDCAICLRPDQDEGGKVHWQKMDMVDASVSHIKLGNRFYVKKDKTLVIREVDITDAGQYFCVRGVEVENIVQLDILYKEPQRIVKDKQDGKPLDLTPAYKLVEHNLEVFTQWSEWGECDICGKMGTRRRFGTCMVKKINNMEPISPVDVPVMRLYLDGVPCRSTVLVRPIAHLRGIRKRKSELITADCFKACPSTPPPIKVTDANGRVVEVIESGFHSLDTKPELPPLVKRKVLYEPMGSNLVLNCLTSEKSKIRWQRGDRPINARTITKQTRGRVSVDRHQRLHIRRLRMRDSAPYSCWVWQNLEATMKVVVFKPMDENIKHYITYGGLFLTIFLLVLVCFCKICCSRPKRHR